ncbi:MAG: DUF2336 domain-containing protein [Alphaproteobacteria bacterium]|nr:MAG: DUF2336 domain-containing protein [Alphaproteobacteria bacterium]
MSRVLHNSEVIKLAAQSAERGTFGKKRTETKPVTREPTAWEKMQVTQLEGLKAKDMTDEEQLSFFLSRLSDLLVQPSEKMPPQERALIDDVAHRITKLVSKEILVSLSERLIAQHATPPALIKALLLSDEEVALPLLRSTMKFADPDLIAVVKNKSEAHQVAVARRENLPTTVCEAIVSHGSEAALRHLLGNLSSQISRQSYVLLSQRSLTDPSLLDLLIERETFPADIAHLVFWWCRSKERKRIIERFSCQRETIREIIPEDFLLALRDKGGPSSFAARMILKPERLPREDVEAALSALQNGDNDKVLSILSEGAGIKEETVAQILDDSGGEAAAVLAKACHFGRAGFLRLRHILCELKGQPWDEREFANDTAAIIHDTLSTDRADVVLRYWDRTSREVTD